ncbi:chemotaxis protein CheW [Litoribrevibacter albus]|uniref:Chemotaxis protein CheW n=1 Tax=Litoribrevibacter albus TaxID=1473156 RepID=A0AA37SF86_9GAMM|nr:chemotaxis protein CheW [Litoribrevibacter albus]GLQ32989.1 chemotaxis protein CheW [Litoribrevibacter albus]
MAENNSDGQWLSFIIADECYVHDVTYIKSIVLYDVPQEVPGAIDGMEGILNVRGEAISIFSGRRVLGIPAGEPNDQWRIILFDYPGGSFGIIVDAVDSLVNFSERDIDRNSQQSESELIQGTIHFDQRLMIVLDCGKACVRWLNE